MDHIEKLKTLLEAAPHDSFLQHALALEHIKAGNPGEARMLFESILLRDPGYTGSYYHLAGLLEKTGETGLAKQWYEKGMAAAREAKDIHAYQELLAALEELEEQ